MVGFQTKLKHGAQSDVFRTIPGPQNGAVFARLGGLHRNTFINSPAVCSTVSPETQGRPAPALRRPDHRASKAMSKAPRWGLLAGRMAAADTRGVAL